MIEKIITIKNVTKFQDFHSIGDIELRRLTLFYAENGKGKSSLAAIFRSFSSGDPSHILAKHTIGIEASPYIQIKYEGNIAEFIDEARTQTSPNILVFDSSYVNSNIFSGDHIDHNHKKNLYYLLIGAPNVRLASAIEQLDSGIREANNRISEVEKDIKRSIVGNLELQRFLQLAPLSDIDSQISKQSVLLNSLKKVLDIQSTPILCPIILPLIEINKFNQILGKTIADITKNVEDDFKHYCTAIGKNSESWISNGLDYAKQNEGICPFCGQEITQSILVKLYSDYFSEAYSDFKDEILKFKNETEKIFSADILINIQREIGDNNTRILFWKEHVQENYPDFDFNSLKNAFEHILSEAIILIRRKYDAPLESVTLSDEMHEALEEYKVVSHTIDSYNSAIKRINNLIQQKKAEIIVQSINDAQEKMIILQNVKIRNEPNIDSLCRDYLALIEDKSRMTTEKGNNRDQLNRNTIEVIELYQSTLNSLLNNFGAEFQINKAQTSHQGGRPSASYSLLINGESIPLGSEDTLDKPGFKTTLSDGEKNTLAFAFFVTQALSDPDLTNKIIVIDDPITSLDEHRKLCTKHEILKIAGIARQVIVLSHDPMFLKSISEDYQAPKPLIIKRCGHGSIIEEWDINTATQSRYQKNYCKLREYLNNNEGELGDVAPCIRPLLEGYLRVRFPDEFGPKEWLGDFIKNIKEAGENESLAILKSKLEELANINDFSKRFHHDTDMNYSSNRENVTDAELKPWVRRTIDFIKST